jgi:hypothetical protein
MYNINTKAKRTELLNHIKESRINKGFNLEIFEGLQIFTKFDDLVKKFILEVYCDNSTKPLLNYYYTNEAQMLTRIQTTKDNYLSRQKYKAERKANQGKKITLATLKTFFNKNSDNIYIKELSRFDGMVDCVMPTKDDFSQVKRREDISDNDLGFSGCWLVGSSRDSISLYEDDIYTGFQVYNACGSWIAATPKQVKKEVIKPTQAEVKQGSVDILVYGKGLAVIGETYAIKDKLKAIGGRFNKFLTVGAGWVFTSDKLEDIKTMLLSIKESKEVEQAEEVQEISTEEAKTTLQDEVNKTLDFFAQTDLKMTGQITEGTKECFNVQQPEVEEFTTLQGIEQAAKEGKIISLCNLSKLINQEQRKAIN